MTDSTSELRFLLKHSSIYGLGNLLSRAVGFLLLPLYTRYLTPTDYGILELLDVTTGLVGIVVGIGVASAMGRFYFDFSSDKDRRRVVSTVYIIAIAVSAVALTALSFSTGLFAKTLLGRPELGYLFRLTFASLAVGMVMDVSQIYLRILQKSFVFVGISLTNLVISVGLNVLFVVHFELGVAGILYGNLLTKLIIAVPVTTVIMCLVGLRFDWSLSKAMFRYSLPLIPSQLANTAVNYSDRYFINYFISTQATGIYGLAQKLGTVMHVLLTSPFIMTFMPRRFEIATRSGTKDIFREIYNYYMLVITCATLLLCIFADAIVRLMTTPQFYAAANLIPLVSFIVLVLGMKYHFQFGIFYSKKTYYEMYINIVSLTLHATLNFFLIRVWGIWGALYASLSAISTTIVLTYIVAQREFRIPYDLAKNVKLVGTAIIFFLLSRLPITEVFAFDIAYKVAVFAAFLGSIAVTRIVTAEELANFRQLLLRIIGRKEQQEALP